MNKGEKFHIRGIGVEWNLPCFITGEPPEKTLDLKPNIAAFVEDKVAGERVIEMLGGENFAFLDYRAHEPNRVQIKIGTTQDKKDALGKLAELVSNADNIITKEMIEQVRKEFTTPSTQPV